MSPDESCLELEKYVRKSVENLFSPMVMAAEPGKSGIELENSSKLSVYTRSKSPKNIEIFAKSLSAEIRNGVMAPRNIAISVETNETNERGVKMESNSASPMKAIDGYGEEKLFSLDNNSNNNGNSDVSSSPQEKLILLHSNLIERQEQIIRKKDKEILDLKQEKEQLEARIKRMERRMTLMMHKSQLDNDDDNELSPFFSHSKNRKSLHKRKPSLSDLMRRKSIPVAAPVIISSTMPRSVNMNKCLKTETLYMSKDLSLTKDQQYANVTPKNDETFGSDDVPIPQFRIIESYASSHQTCGSLTRSSVKEDKCDDATDYENMDDETFGKRHAKPEADEKRRKRWDIQHYRARKQREELEEKYKQREEARLKGRKIASEREVKSREETLLPDFFQIDTVEMCETVPVTAFGAPIQTCPITEFELPWFDVDKRERQEREKLIRSKARNRRRAGRRYYDHTGT
ncbi:male-specific lethal 1-like 1 isoform X2 [Xenia sp. Carnegie-2017]|uniref:male-specific lethal 1-like 1 isoform X2 n=1 Tax=Xenia sp. Carnegie-2017 TaxID=2897299 RepID=UPI001F04C61B|nr:male-specific lethal 1-like 1 isoform X2 [Xenia sp. Carnegie-2017]